MAVYSNVEIEYLGEQKTLDDSLIVDNKYQEHDDASHRVTEYFIFTAQTVASATITYNTGSDDADWIINIKLVKITNHENTFAFVVTAPYNTSLSESNRTITIGGTIHVDRTIGPHVSCHLTFSVKNNSPMQSIYYQLSDEYVNAGNSHFFIDFLEKNLYSGYFYSQEEEKKIYKIVARKFDIPISSRTTGYSDCDYDSYLPDADTSFDSTKKRYYIGSYDVPYYTRIIDKENTYSIGEGLLSYGNALIGPIEDSYNQETNSGRLYFASVLHAIGYKAFSFCDHKHYESISDDDCGNTTYFGSLIQTTCLKKVDAKSAKQREYLSRQDGINITGFLKSISLPETVKIIGNQAFKYCTSLETVDTANIEIIGMYAFEGCDKLTSIPGSNHRISQIGEGAFKNSGILQIDSTVGELQSLTDVECSVFLNCRKLGHIDLSNTGIKKIGRLAFANCGSDLSSGVSLSLNQSLEIIAGSSFSGCEFNTIVSIPSSVKNIDARAFANSKMSGLEFPYISSANSSTIELGKKAFRSVEITNPDAGIVITPRIQNISDKCFEFAKAKFIQISTGVTSIGLDAFHEADLEYIQFDGNGDTMPYYEYTDYHFVKSGPCILKASHAFIDNVVSQGSAPSAHGLAEVLYSVFYLTNKYDYTD